MPFILALLTIAYVGRDNTGRLTDLACWFIIGVAALWMMHLLRIAGQVDRGERERPWWIMADPE